MEAFPEYWGEAAKAQSLVIRWSTEGNQRVTELQSGTVDGIDNVPPESFATIQGDPQFQLMPREGLNVFYVGFNNNPKNEGFDNSTNLFANEKVRQAVAKGINRDQIVSEFYPPGSARTSTLNTVQHRERLHRRSVVRVRRHRRQGAAGRGRLPGRLPDQAELPAGNRGYLPDPPAVAQAIQAQLLANLGIDATLDPQDDTTHLDTADAGPLDGCAPARLGRRLSGHDELP